jgi:hypothetical protein
LIAHGWPGTFNAGPDRLPVVKGFVSVVFSFGVGALFLLSGCDSDPASSIGNAPFDPGPEHITMEVEYPFPDVVVVTTPGMSAGPLRHGRIDRNGVLSKPRYHGIPNMSRQLSEEEHRSIIGKLINHPFPAAGTWEPRCADTPEYEVSFSNQFYDHYYRLDCGGFIGPGADQAFLNRLEFFEAFIGLFDSMLVDQAPWKGLETFVRVDDRVYLAGDTVRMEAGVHNPTDSTRIALFNKQSPFRLFGSYEFQTWSSEGEPWICVAGTGLGYEDTCRALEFHVSPGDSLVYSLYLPLSAFDYGPGDNTVRIVVNASTTGYRLPASDVRIVVRN